MKKKFFAVAIAATMALSTVMTAMAEDLYTKEYALQSTDAYEEFENPLKDRNLSEIVIEYTCTTSDGAAANGWDGLFAFYNADTNGRITFCTRPYLCWNDMSGGKGYLDFNHPDNGGDFALVAGQKQTVVWTITADDVTCTVDVNAINLGTLGTSNPAPTYQDLLDAFNTYPTLTIGVGKAKSSFWWTELASGKLVISTTSGKQITEEQEDPTVYVQYKKVSDNNYTVRVVGEVTLDGAFSDSVNTSYKGAGFRCTKAIANMGTAKAESYVSTVVFKSLVANGVTKKAADGKYFIVTEITNVPADATFYVNPVYQLSEGGTTASFTEKNYTIKMADIIK